VAQSPTPAQSPNSTSGDSISPSVLVDGAIGGLIVFVLGLLATGYRSRRTFEASALLVLEELKRDGLAIDFAVPEPQPTVAAPVKTDIQSIDDSAYKAYAPTIVLYLSSEARRRVFGAYGLMTPKVKDGLYDPELRGTLRSVRREITEALTELQRSIWPWWLHPIKRQRFESQMKKG
jgi:hypothetical protein